MNNLISVTEAAQILGVTSARVRQMIAENVIRTARKIGPNWAIDVEEIEMLHERRTLSKVEAEEVSQ